MPADHDQAMTATPTLTGAAGHAPYRRLHKRIYARLRGNGSVTLAFVTLAVFVNSTMNLYGSGAVEAIYKKGFLVWMAEWLSGIVLPSFVASFIVFGCLCASSDHGSDTVRRPWRFVLVLLTSSVGATAAVWAVLLAIGRSKFALSELPLVGLFSAWQQIVYCGALFGWMYMLYLRRIEDGRKFSLLLTRRSMLARQVAQSRLLATRSQVDPEMVARVLREVRTRYAIAPEQASALLDHMISYLRLAMNRLRDQKPSLMSELTLCRSYLALREAETGVPISFTQNGHSACAAVIGAAGQFVPLFLIIRQMLAQALQSGAPQITLQLEFLGDEIDVQMRIKAQPPEAAELSRLHSNLDDLLAGGKLILLHSFDSGVNQYVAKLSAQ